VLFKLVSERISLAKTKGCSASVSGYNKRDLTINLYIHKRWNMAERQQDRVWAEQEPQQEEEEQQQQREPIRFQSFPAKATQTWPTAL